MSIKVHNSFRFLPKPLITIALNSMESTAALFVRLKITPNMLSTLALLAGAGAGLLFATGYLFWAAVLMAVCGFFDVIDGTVAARMNRKSLFGAIFDSSLDRYSEFFIYLGLAVYFRNHWTLWVIFWTFLGSTMVSYTRARAEGLGIDCRIGLMQRAERMLLLILGTLGGLIFNVFDPVMTWILILIATVSNITAFQRIFYVKKSERQIKTQKLT